MHSLNAADLGLDTRGGVSGINLYDHLTPRIQELLHESKKVKGCQQLQKLLGEEWIRLFSEDGQFNTSAAEELRRFRGN